MKKTARHLLMLLSMVLLYPPVSVYAFTGSVPADGGTYYLYNVGKQAFVYGDNDWGTRVSLTQQGGIPVTLVSSGEAGRYYISTAPTYPDLFLGYDGYVDKASTDADNYTSWLFTAVEGQTNVYTLKATKNDKYWLVGRASDNKTTRVTSAPADNYGYWMLVTRAALVADLAGATTDNPKDATKFIVNPNFGVKTSGAGWTETPKIGGHTNYQCAERWNISSFDVAQTLTDMPNGIYKMNIQGFYRVGGSADNATEAAAARTAGSEALNAKYYINDVEGTLMSIFDNTRCLANNSTYNASTAYDVSGTSYYVPNDLSRASSCLGLC